MGGDSRRRVRRRARRGVRDRERARRPARSGSATGTGTPRGRAPVCHAAGGGGQSSNQLDRGLAGFSLENEETTALDSKVDPKRSRPGGIVSFMRKESHACSSRSYCTYCSSITTKKPPKSSKHRLRDRHRLIDASRPLRRARSFRKPRVRFAPPPPRTSPFLRHPRRRRFLRFFRRLETRGTSRRTLRFPRRRAL